ncbi:MAG: hypothetical protein KDK70_17250, partial [Myxococcales bacterium]|nr:hypothetical protein [Myxococcales bacterium]
MPTILRRDALSFLTRPQLHELARHIGIPHHAGARKNVLLGLLTKSEKCTYPTILDSLPTKILRKMCDKYKVNSRGNRFALITRITGQAIPLREAILQAPRPSRLPPALHLTHLCNAKDFAGFVENKRLTAPECDVFNKKIVYLFYGRLLYRTQKGQPRTPLISRSGSYSDQEPQKNAPVFILSTLA